jgi:hypothetical protein
MSEIVNTHNFMLKKTICYGEGASRKEVVVEIDVDVSVFDDGSSHVCCYPQTKPFVLSMPFTEYMTDDLVTDLSIMNKFTPQFRKIELMLILESFSCNMENYSFFDANMGVSENDFEDVATAIIKFIDGG